MALKNNINIGGNKLETSTPYIHALPLATMIFLKANFILVFCVVTEQNLESANKFQFSQRSKKHARSRNKY